MDLAASLRAMHERVSFDRRRHTYAVDGRSLDSVTKVIESTLAKGEGFMGWVAKMTREGKDFRKVAREEADKGHAVHRVVENWARQKLGLDLLPDLTVSAEASFLASGLPEYLDSKGVEPICQPEVRTFSLRFGYAGTIDLAATWRGHPTIFDLKTCRRADDCWDSWRAQNGAYRGAAEENGCGKWRGAILRVPKDGGSPNILAMDDPEDFEAFKYLHSVFRWARKERAEEVA